MGRLFLIDLEWKKYRRDPLFQSGVSSPIPVIELPPREMKQHSGIDDLVWKKYTCKHCQAHLALFDDIISKSFHGRHGRAYLFDKVVNVTVGEKEERLLSTGIHTVVDVFNHARPHNRHDARHRHQQVGCIGSSDKS